MINLKDFKKLKQKEYYQKMILNKIKKQKKLNKFIKEYNKIDNIYNFGIDKTYNLSILHSKIKWFRYYLEYYLSEYLEKQQTIKNNKVVL